MIDLVCQHCGKGFSVRWQSQAEGRKYCSKACWYEHAKGPQNPSWNGGGTPIVCASCGEVFRVTSDRENTAKYCSIECRSAAGGVDLTCSGCGEGFSVPPVRSDEAKYCGWDCYSEHRYGENASNWRGGPVTVECETCGDLMELSPARADGRRFCSHACFAAREQGISSLEMSVATELARRSVDYEWQVSVGVRFVADFVVGGTIIECDGGYWHSLPGAAERDARKDEACREAGYRVVRLSESEINEDVSAAVDRALTP